MQDSVIVDIPTASKIVRKTADGNSTITVAEFVSGYQDGLVRYKLNSEGKLRSIEIPSASSAAEGFRLGYENTSSNYYDDRYYNAYMLIGTSTPVSSETKVFNLPPEGKEDDLNLYSVSTIGKMSDKSKLGKFKAYMYDNDIYTDVLVTKSSTELGKESGVMFVEYISTTWDKTNEESRTTICGMVGGSQREYMLYEQGIKAMINEKSSSVDVASGDIIRFSRNGVYISYMEMLHDYSTGITYGHSNIANSESNSYGDYAFFEGNILSVQDGKYLQMKVLNKANKEMYLPLTSDTRIYSYSIFGGAPKVSIISADEIPNLEDDPMDDSFTILITNETLTTFVGIYDVD